MSKKLGRSGDGVSEKGEERLHNQRYFISHTKSYNAFKFSTAACNPIQLALKDHLPTSN